MQVVFGMNVHTIRIILSNSWFFLSPLKYIEHISNKLLIKLAFKGVCCLYFFGWFLLHVVKRIKVGLRFMLCFGIKTIFLRMERIHFEFSPLRTSNTRLFFVLALLRTSTHVLSQKIIIVVIIIERTSVHVFFSFPSAIWCGQGRSMKIAKTSKVCNCYTLLLFYLTINCLMYQKQ